MALNPRRTALLVCDMQERFRGAVYGFDAISLTIAKMIKAAVILDMPVLTTEQNPKALGATVIDLGLDKLPPHLNLGIFPKTKFSMYTPEVCKALGGVYDGDKDGEGIENVIVVGIESHVCVYQTCLDFARANGSGPRPIVVADAVSSVNPQEIPIALDRLRHAGIDVATSESVLFQLMGDAAGSHFKAFSGMIKDEKDANAQTLQKMLGKL